jgi:hypothetical protein
MKAYAGARRVTPRPWAPPGGRFCLTGAAAACGSELWMTTSVALSWSARAELSEGAILFDPGRSFSLAMAGPGRSRQKPASWIADHVAQYGSAGICRGRHVAFRFAVIFQLPNASLLLKFRPIRRFRVRASAEFGPP